MIDVRSSLKTINIALNANVDLGQKYQSIFKELNELVQFIATVHASDSLYMHYSRKRSLAEAIRLGLHLRDLIRYTSNHGDKNQHDEILQTFYAFRENLEMFSYSGSVYLFRHCKKNKVSRWWNKFSDLHMQKKAEFETKKALAEEKQLAGEDVATVKEEMYEGIPGPEIKTQALFIAKQLCDQIQLSTKPVKLYLYHTELSRTKLFAELVLREINKRQDLMQNKVEVAFKDESPYIKFNLWSKEALQEVDEMYGDPKRGEWYTFINWFNHTNEFLNFKHQPEPQAIVNNVIQFFDEALAKINQDTDKHVIVLGFSHSFVIDAFLAARFSNYLTNIKSLINTAGFVKWECGEFNYLGQWVK